MKKPPKMKVIKGGNKPKMSLKKRLLFGMIFLAISAGLFVSGKYYIDGMPKYKVGECLFDEQEGVALKITGIQDGKYQFLAQILVFVMKGEMDIRQLNKQVLVKFNCETGERLDGKALSTTDNPESSK